MRSTVLAAAAAVLAFCAAAHAAGEQGLASEILACAAQPDEKSQLACYNGIVAQLKAAQTAAPPTAAEPSQPAAPPQATAQQESGSWYDPSSWFGSEKPKPPPRPQVGNPADFGSENMPVERSTGPEPIDHITAKVVSASYNYFRRFTITLDNGQVWRQGESDDRIARFGDGGGETVTISRGLLNTFGLIIEGRRGSYSVKRIK